MKSFILSTIFALSLVGSAFANPTEGEQFDDSYVSANGSTYYDVWFNAGELANVDLVGHCDETQDIDLWVYDENGNEIVKSTTYGCFETVEWIPDWTGRFRIVVENHDKPYDTNYHIDFY